MDHLIYDIAKFYRMILDSMLSADLGTVVTVASTALWAGAGAIYLLWRYLDWVGESSENGARTIKFFSSTYSKFFMVWFLVMASPVIFWTMASWAGKRVAEAADGPMVDATQGLFSQMMDTSISMIDLEGAYANAMFTANPATNFLSGYTIGDTTGMTDSQNQAATLNAVQAQEMAMRDLNAQLTAAQRMAESSNVERARVGQQAVADLQSRIDSTKTTLSKLKDQKDVKKVDPPKDDGWFAKITSGVQTGLWYGVAIVNSLYTIPWMVIYHLAAIVTLLPGILLSLWGAWKLIGASVELFSYLFSLAAKVAIGTLISVGLAPLSMLSLLFPATQEYGKHLISWWFQVILTALTLSVVVTLGAAGIGAVTDSVGGYGVELTRLLLGGLSGTVEPSIAIVESIKAGLTILSVGYSMTFMTSLTKACAQSASSLLTGHFHA